MTTPQLPPEIYQEFISKFCTLEKEEIKSESNEGESIDEWFAKVIEQEKQKAREEQIEKDAEIAEEENEEKYAGYDDLYELQKAVAKEIRSQNNS